jgi:hypothetical protein
MPFGAGSFLGLGGLRLSKPGLQPRPKSGGHHGRASRPPYTTSPSSNTVPPCVAFRFWCEPLLELRRRDEIVSCVHGTASDREDAFPAGSAGCVDFNGLKICAGFADFNDGVVVAPCGAATGHGRSADMRQIALGLMGCFLLATAGCCGSSWSCVDGSNPCGNSCGCGCGSWSMPRFGGLFGRSGGGCCSCGDTCWGAGNACGCGGDVMTTSCGMPVSCGSPSCSTPTFSQSFSPPSSCASCAAPQVNAAWGNATYVNGPLAGTPVASGPVANGAVIPSQGMVYESTWTTPQQQTVPGSSALSEPAPLPPAIPGTAQ